MPVKQYLALSVQTIRTALDALPTYMFYPVKGKLEPEPTYKEESVTEWRGIDTAQGNTGDNEERTSTEQKYAWDSRIYPGSELVALFQFLFGTWADPVALTGPDAAASRYLFATTSTMYDEGTQLADTALALIPNTRKGSSTYSQNYLGHRPKDLELGFKGGEAAEMKINFMSGPWIGDPEQPAIDGVSFPAARAFKSVPKVYLGAGGVLTGSAPLYQDFLPGTMAYAKPDDLTIKYDTGQEDEIKMNGLAGPSVTVRKKQVVITIEYTHDFSDPANGWSSYEAWEARFGGITYLPFMMMLDSGEVIPGCTNQTFQLGLYLPKMKITTDQPDRKTDGTKDKIKVKLESRVDSSVNVAAFAKLIC